MILKEAVIMKEVLVECGSSKNIVKFESSFLASDRKSIMQKLIVLAQTNPYLKAHIEADKFFILQRYNKEFDCFVDVTDQESVNSKEHLKMVFPDDMKDVPRQEKGKKEIVYSAGMKRPISDEEEPISRRPFQAGPAVREDERRYPESDGQWSNGAAMRRGPMPPLHASGFDGYNPGRMLPGRGMPFGLRGRGGPGGFLGRGGPWGPRAMMEPMPRGPMNSWSPPQFYGSGDDGWYEGDCGLFDPSEGSGIPQPWVAQMEAEEKDLDFKRKESAQVKKIYSAAYCISDRQPVQVLNEYCQKNNFAKPTYELVIDGSNKKSPIFQYKVMLDGKTFEADRHSTVKKQARVYAAIKALYVLRALF